MDRQTAMKRLFAPKTVAVFGGASAAAAISQCRVVGYDGEMFAVNPGRKELNGVQCVATAADLPKVPDAAFVAAPPNASVQIIRDLSALGAGGAVCYASGFAELGAAGIDLQIELREAAGDMAVVGPNCHGFVNYLDGVALWPDEHGGSRVDSGVALVTQSGNFGINLSMQQRGVDLGYVITIGNKSCLGLHDYIEFLIRDSRVTAIGLHIEGIDKVHEFSIAALKALEAGVPIVAIKTGRSMRGAEINMSHTASLAGEDRLYEALFQRLGIARCNTVTQFLETLKFLSIAGPLTEPTVGSMSCSGGEASLIADYAEAVGLDMPKLSESSAVGLAEILGPKVPLSNPLDYHTYAWGNYEQLNACFSTMLTNAFACTMLVIDYPPGENANTASWELAERALIDAAASAGQRAVVVSTLPETMPEAARTRLKEAGIAPMQGLDECLSAISAAAKIGAAQKRAADTLPVRAPESLAGDPRLLDELESKAELAERGLAVPRASACSAGEAVAAADAIGYPVVVKALSDEITHKTDAGAVRINLADGAAVAAAVESMSPAFDRFFVEEMARPTVAELIVGVNRDTTFGLTLLIGAGGTLVELIDDTVSLLLPVRRDEIAGAVRSLKVMKLIDAWRGGESGDFEGIIDAVCAIADYATEHNATLVELDVNPLIVTPRGAIAADAVIRRTGQ
ncbi:MAG: acetate--CoA ligase family protein [Gammaproteobacteria bacterium]|nr:acetate--CoA ligase family protein [Gammaproteobacteria bacterium]